jgi:hypothetical protein
MVEFVEGVGFDSLTEVPRPVSAKPADLDSHGRDGYTYIRCAPNRATMRDFVFIGFLAGLPVVVLLIGIWMLVSKRALAVHSAGELAPSTGSRAGTLLVVGASILFLLLLAFWRLAVEHEGVATTWLLCGLASLVTALVFGLRARGTARVYVVLSSLALIPPWVAVAGLLVKAAMD